MTGDDAFASRLFHWHSDIECEYSNVADDAEKVTYSHQHIFYFHLAVFLNLLYSRMRFLILSTQNYILAGFGFHSSVYGVYFSHCHYYYLKIVIKRVLMYFIHVVMIFWFFATVCLKHYHSLSIINNMII